MHLLSLVIALALQAQSPPQEPRRVTPDGPPAVKPIYRELKQGEERVEGLLQRVECPYGRPVTFVVKLKDRVAKYQASRLDAVEYIAYTPDFKGPMSCGGRGARGSGLRDLEGGWNRGTGGGDRVPAAERCRQMSGSDMPFA